MKINFGPASSRTGVASVCALRRFGRILFAMPLRAVALLVMSLAAAGGYTSTLSSPALWGSPPCKAPPAVVCLRLRGGWDDDYDHTRVFEGEKTGEEAREVRRIQERTHDSVRKAAAIHRRVREVERASLELRDKEALPGIVDRIDNSTYTFLHENDETSVMNDKKSELARQHGLSQDARVGNKRSVLAKYEDLIRAEEARRRQKDQAHAHCAAPTSLCLNEWGVRYSPSRGQKTVLTFDDVLKVELNTLVNKHVVASAYTQARRPHFEELLMAAYDGVREGVKHSGPDQILCEVADVVRETVESYECSIGRDTRPVVCIETPEASRRIVRESTRGAQIIPIKKVTEGERSAARMEEGGVYELNVLASTGRGNLIKGANSTDFRRLRDWKARKSEVEMPRAKDLMLETNSLFGSQAWCKRYLEDRGETKLDPALRHLLDKSIIQEYPPMRDTTGSFVAQHEHTVIMTDQGSKEIVSQCNEWGQEPRLYDKDEDIFNPNDDLEMLNLDN